MTSRKRQSKKKKGGKKRNKVRPSSRFVLKEKEALLPDTSDPSGKATRLTSFGKGLVASQKEREGEMKGESSPSLRLGGSRFLLLACCSRSVASESACVRACAGVWKGGRRGGEPTLSGEKKLARGQPGGAGAKRRVVSLLVIARPPLPPPLFPPPHSANQSCTAVRVTRRLKLPFSASYCCFYIIIFPFSFPSASLLIPSIQYRCHFLFEVLKVGEIVSKTSGHFLL